MNNNLSSLLKQHNLHDLDSDFLDQMLSSVPNSTTTTFPWAPADDPGFFSHQMNKSSSMLHHQQQQMLINSRALESDHNEVVDGSSFESDNQLHENDASVFNSGFNSEHFHHNQGGGGMQTTQKMVANGSGWSGGGQPRQRVRAKRGHATDPHSIAERLRRERIAERMKNLQELVPNGNKTDKASMLDEIIDYVKFLQLQVKVLSVSRLGGAAAVAPLATNMTSQGRGGNGSQIASSSNNNNGTIAMENDVAKLLEEDMGPAMQYLQGKGLCLMPISLASAISIVTRNPNNQGPTSPSMSGLTVQSATIDGNGNGEPFRKDVNSVSKP